VKKDSNKIKLGFCQSVKQHEFECESPIWQSIHLIVKVIHKYLELEFRCLHMVFLFNSVVLKTVLLCKFFFPYLMIHFPSSRVKHIFLMTLM